MTLTVVWHDVVLIANPVNMVYYDHSVLHYTFGLSKNVFPPGRIRNSFPPLPYFGQTLFPPLSNLPFFCSSPQNSLPPPQTHTEKMIGPQYIHISFRLFKVVHFVPFGFGSQFQSYLFFEWIAILLLFLRGFRFVAPSPPPPPLLDSDAVFNQNDSFRLDLT